jgi:L-fuconate dehydratase
MHTDPDYSAAYVVLETDGVLRSRHGDSRSWRTRQVVCAAVRFVAHRRRRSIAGLPATWRNLALADRRASCDGSAWKGAIHLATASIVNAAWDLWAKSEGKPVWKLGGHDAGGHRPGCIDFRCLTDADAGRCAGDPRGQHRDEGGAGSGDAARRISGTSRPRDGYGADEQVTALCEEALARASLQNQVGRDAAESVPLRAGARGDRRRVRVDDRRSQAWDVGERSGT